jgi:hypothetical protein
MATPTKATGRRSRAGTHDHEARSRPDAAPAVGEAATSNGEAATTTTAAIAEHRAGRSAGKPQPGLSTAGHPRRRRRKRPGEPAPT